MHGSAPHPPGPAGASTDALAFDEHGRLRSILERRQVAMVPSVAFLIVSLATIVSVIIRPGERAADLPIVLWSLVLAATGAIVALRIDGPLARRLRGMPATYLVIGTFMSIVLGVLAWVDGGLGSVYFTTTIAVATYLGLVLPTRWAAAPLVSLGVVTACLELFRPAGTFTENVAAPLLIIAGWSLGRVGHRFHQRAAASALQRSRSDELTDTLNRRGFFEQLEYELRTARAAGRPLSLLLVDLNGFKAVNDARGHAAGDEVLRWVGEQFPAVLPESAAAGRLGGDEFAIALPGMDAADAKRCANTLRLALSARIGASIGVATSSPDGPLDADRLVRTADARMYAQKHGGTPATVEHHAVGRHSVAEADDAAAPTPPPVTYAAVQAHAQRARARGGRRAVRSMNPIGQFTVLVSGLALAQSQLMGSASTDWDPRLRALMLPWAVANLVLMALTISPRRATSRRAGHAIYLGYSMILGIGITFTSLAGSGLGIASPVAATFFLKVIYDGFATNQRQSRRSTAILLGWWGLLAALGPADSLWVAPFQLAMFGAARAVGLEARNAFTDGTRQMLHLASADPLTGLRNRAGYRTDLRRALGRAAAGEPFAVVALDLDDFKRVNDEQGHDAGDALLCRVADALREALPDALCIARIGGDEFAALLPHTSRQELCRRFNCLTAELEPLVGASAGHAIYGEDGTDGEALLQVADARSYEAKRLRRAGRPARGDGPAGTLRTADEPC